VAAGGEIDTVGFLLDNGASVHVINLFGDTPLMASAVMALLSFFFP